VCNKEFKYIYTYSRLGKRYNLKVSQRASPRNNVEKEALKLEMDSIKVHSTKQFMET